MHARMVPAMERTDSPLSICVQLSNHSIQLICIIMVALFATMPTLGSYIIIRSTAVPPW